MPVPFTPTADLGRFVSAPGNRVRVRRHFASWKAKGVQGTITWGKATDVDVVDMCQVFDALLASPMAAQPSITDLRALESVSVVAFERLVQTLTERHSVWHARAGRQAVIHAGTFPGATVLGAFQIAASDYDLAVFSDPAEAFAWVGAAQHAIAVEALRASLLDVPDIVRRVRVVFGASEDPLSVAQVSRALGLSTRSLQRHLAAAGTSMRAERSAHVLARAERLLEGTDLDLGAISAMLGLSSPGRLVSLFRATKQTTPGAWRADQRR